MSGAEKGGRGKKWPLFLVFSVSPRQETRNKKRPKPKQKRDKTNREKIGFRFFFWSTFFLCAATFHFHLLFVQTHILFWWCTLGPHTPTDPQIATAFLLTVDCPRSSTMDCLCSTEEQPAAHFSLPLRSRRITGGKLLDPRSSATDRWLCPRLWRWYISHAVPIYEGYALPHARHRPSRHHASPAVTSLITR
jgi:hypothetical protein